MAMLRDRKPSPYDDFVVTDLSYTYGREVTQWRKDPFDVIIMWAALGPGKGDLPIEVLDAATAFLEADGLLNFTVNT